MQSLDNQIWRSHVSTSTKLKLYNVCLLPLFLYGSVSRTDAWKIDAFDQWCLRMLLGIKWHQFDRNHEIQRLTDNPNSLANGTTQTHCSKLTAIVQSRRLTLFGHIARMDGNIDAKRILSTLSPEDWRSPRGCPASHGWAPYSRIWDPTISHCLKQWIWPRTSLCGGCGRRMVLHNLELHARYDDGNDSIL